MKQFKFLVLMSLLLAAAALTWGDGQSYAKNTKTPPGQAKKITQADRQAAAARSLQQGALNPLMVAPLAARLD